MINLSQKFGLALGLGILSFFPNFSVLAAENITFSIAPLGEFDISINSLAIFAKEGKITADFALYAKHFTPEELAKLSSLLNKSFPVNEVEAFEFFNTKFGKEVVKQLSLAINSPSDQSQPLLQGAVISAAANPNGFKIIDVLKNYASPTLALNLETIRNTIFEADRLYQTTDRIFAWLDRQASNTILTPLSVDLSELAQAGKITWTSETLTIPRPQGEPLTVFVNLPQKLTQPAPVIVITPGLNSNFQSLRYGLNI